MFISWKNNLVLLLLLGLIYGCNGSNSQKLEISSQNSSQNKESVSASQEKKTSISGTTSSVNLLNKENYPQSHCGDTLPENKESYPISYYPVYIEKGVDNLSLIKSQWCRDALARELGELGEVIQVASFSSQEQAELFRQFLTQQISVEGWVGKPSVINNVLK